VRAAPGDRAPHGDGEHSCHQLCGPLRDHRTTRPHTCDSRCRPHACKPMRPATILRIRSIISSALDLAVVTNGPDATSPRTPARRILVSGSQSHQVRNRPPGSLTSSGPRMKSSACTLGFLHHWRPARRGYGATGEPVRFQAIRGPVGQQLSGQARPADRKAPKDGQGRRLSLDPHTCELLTERFTSRRMAARLRRPLRRRPRKHAVVPRAVATRNTRPPRQGDLERDRERQLSRAQLRHHRTKHDGPVIAARPGARPEDTRKSPGMTAFTEAATVTRE
jgi:hypothetical protein